MPQMQKRTRFRVSFGGMFGVMRPGCRCIAAPLRFVIADDLGCTQAGQVLVFGRRGLFRLQSSVWSKSSAAEPSAGVMA